MKPASASKCARLALAIAALAQGTTALADPVPASDVFERALREAIVRSVGVRPAAQDFGWLADLAGHCWATEARPVALVCYWFSADGRSLHSRQYLEGQLQGETRVSLTGWPGELVELSRRVAGGPVQQHRLRFGGPGGSIYRQTAYDGYRHDDFERRGGAVQTESLQRVAHDRFDWVRTSGNTDGWGWGPHHAGRHASTWRWSFVRVRPFTSPAPSADAPW